MSDLPTIIIADRDPIFSSTLRVTFSELGFRSLLAVDGTEATQYAECTAAALVLVEVGLLGLSGYDACARIRRLPGYQKTPIVLTALAIPDKMRAAAQAAGATSVLAKPYSITDLLKCVTTHLPPDHPLLVHRPVAPGQREVQWGTPQPLDWKFGADSGLSRNKAFMQVVRMTGVKVPRMDLPTKPKP